VASRHGVAGAGVVVLLLPHGLLQLADPLLVRLALSALPQQREQRL
jgi:hypothetical protein